MDLPTDWTVYPSPHRWDLRFRYDGLDGVECWCRMTNDGSLTALPYPEGAYDIAVSPGGSRALLIDGSSFHEGEYGSWRRIRSVVDLRSGSATNEKIPIESEPVWSNDEARFAYVRATGGDRLRPRDGSILAVRDLGSGLVRESRTRRIRCLRWRPDDRELVAVVDDRDALSLARFSADGLTRSGESALPIAPDADVGSISPDVAFVSFSDFPSDDSEQTLSLCHLADGRVIEVVPQRLDTRAVWSPGGRMLAFRGWADPGRDLGKILAIFDTTTGETVEVASVDEGDDSGDINCPDPVWSPDGGLLAFGSFEEDGGAIFIAQIPSGGHAKVLQTRGLVHSLGFARLP